MDVQRGVSPQRRRGQLRQLRAGGPQRLLRGQLEYHRFRAREPPSVPPDLKEDRHLQALRPGA